MPSTEGTLNGSPRKVPSNETEKVSSSDPQATLEEEDFPHGFKLVVLMVALCLAVFPVAIDNTIVSTGSLFGTISTDQFQSLDGAIAATQLLFGKFYMFLPIKSGRATKRSFGSLIWGVAPNSKALTIGRAIAGLGSAGIFTGALRAISRAAGAMYGIASVAGPLKGGAFTDKPNLLVNLPIGGVTIFAIAFLFKMPKSAELKPIVSLLLALQWGGSKYEWENGRIIALFVILSVFIAAFVAIQIWQQDNATVPPRIFLKRSIWVGAWFSLTLGASFFIFVSYLPIWFSRIPRRSRAACTDNLPMLLSLVLAMILSGILVTNWGYYMPFIWLSTVLVTIGVGMISTFKPDTGHAHWIGYQVIYGFRMGCSMQAPQIAAQIVLELKDVPVGTSIQTFSKTLGGALFVSVGQNVFQNNLISGLIARVPSVNPEIIFLAGATNLKKRCNQRV
ncbi:putative efflux pump antibiotic resistance protein [Mycena olivaceomarginata]|nr:putative efflux pump antibiotic resistance protein [Mycena olivaceomarginata]